MASFLEESNFCDDSDPIFNALSDTITVRNYTPLQQELHQLTLLLMSEEYQANNDAYDESIDIERNPMYINPKRGNCWIFQSNTNAIHHWESKKDDDISVDDPLSLINMSSPTDLWFESSMKINNLPGQVGKDALQLEISEAEINFNKSSNCSPCREDCNTKKGDDESNEDSTKRLIYKCKEVVAATTIQNGGD